MLKNLAIRVKLFIGFGAITALVLVIGVSCFFSMQNIDDKKTDLLIAYETADAIMEAKFFLKKDAQLLMEIISSDNLAEIEIFWGEHLDAKKSINTDLNKAIAWFENKAWGHENLTEKNDFSKQIHEVLDLYEGQINNLFQTMHALIQKTGELESIHEQLYKIDKDLDILISGIEVTMDKIEKELSDSIVKNSKDNMNDTLSRAQKSSLFVMLVSLVVALVLTLSIASVIVNPIGGLQKMIERMSSGDLNSSFSYSSKDEVGQMAHSINALATKLSEIIGGIKEGALGIQGASNQINSGAQQISQSSSEAAASVEEISSSVEEMASNIQQNTDNAKETEKIAAQSAETINKGNESVQITLKSMTEIAERISIINDIALQTNILALNAAVEAARAGEHGKGFAVVAAEVRKLAEHSKNAANQIDDLSINGVKISEEAGKNLNEVVPQIKKTAALIQEISAASVEQSAGAGQINESIQQLNRVAQQNASASEELAATAEELNSQAEQLREMIAFFSV